MLTSLKKDEIIKFMQIHKIPTAQEAIKIMEKENLDFELRYCPICFQMKNHLQGICQKCKSDNNVKINQCIHCKKELVLIKDEFKFTKKQLADFKEQFGQPLPIPKGYRCPKCGACYDADYKRIQLNMHLGQV